MLSVGMWVGGVTQLTVDFARVLRRGWKVARWNRNPKLVLENALCDHLNCWRNLDGRAKIGFFMLSLFCFPGWLQGKKGPFVGGTKVELRHFCFVTPSPQSPSHSMWTTRAVSWVVQEGQIETGASETICPEARVALWPWPDWSSRGEGSSKVHSLLFFFSIIFFFFFQNGFYIENIFLI